MGNDVWIVVDGRTPRRKTNQFLRWKCLFFSPLFSHLNSSLRDSSSCRGWKPRLTFLFPLTLSPPLFHFSRVTRVERVGDVLENQHTDDRGPWWCRARHDSRYKKKRRVARSVYAFIKVEGSLWAGWLPPYRRRNDTRGDRRRMRRKGSGRERERRARCCAGC